MNKNYLMLFTLKKRTTKGWMEVITTGVPMNEESNQDGEQGWELLY